MPKLKFIYLSIFTALLLSACGRSTPTYDSTKIQAIVTIPPQQELVQSIGGDHVQVTVMVPPGASPETYEPTPDQMQAVARGQVYFKESILPFEQVNLDKLRQVNPQLDIVDTSSAIHYRQIEAYNASSGEQGADPHVWLDPTNVILQAATVRNTLVKLQPDHQKDFETNYQVYITKLQQLDIDLKQAFAPIKGKEILVYHPAFGYLTDRYGLIQKSIELSGKEPSPAKVQEIINQAKTDSVKVVFVEKQFSTQAAGVIASEIGGRVVPIDPLAANYITNMHSLAQTISQSLTH